MQLGLYPHSAARLCRGECGLLREEGGVGREGDVREEGGVGRERV